MAASTGDLNNRPLVSGDDSAEAQEEEFCRRYVVFCSTDIPSAMLNDFLIAVRNECPPSSGAVLRIITAKSGPDSIAGTSQTAGGTRPPVSDFHTPFARQSVSALRDEFVQAMQEAVEGWAMSCFAVLDERFLKDGTVLLISIDNAEDEEDEKAEILNHRCDARITLDLLLQFETNGVGVDAHDDDSEDFDHVFTYRYFQERMGAVFHAEE